MKHIFLLLFFSASLLVQAQQKYLIYFKSDHQSSVLQKSSDEYQKALAHLSQRTIERRSRALGKENIILKEDLPIPEEYTNEIKRLGGEIVWELKWFNAVSAFLNEDELNKINNLSFVEKIEPVKILKRKPGDEKNSSIMKKDNSNEAEHTYEYGESYEQFELSDIPEVHDLGFTGNGVRIGFLDAGFDWLDKPAFNNLKVIDTYDFVYKDKNVGNDNDADHGTAVLSLTAGFEDGKFVAPAFNAEVVLAKTEDIFSETRAEEDNFAKGVEWLEEHGVDIMNTSLGYSEFDSGEESYSYSEMDGETALVTRAYEAAFKRGVITVTSAGNEGNYSWKHITAPADGKNVLTIGAVSGSNNIAGFSSRGPTADGRIKPDVVAYGVGNYHATPYERVPYSTGSGTSYSGPIVTGIVGQVLSAFPYLSNTQMRKIIIESGDNVANPNNSIGYGLVSALRAITFPNLEKELSSGNVIYKLHKIFPDIKPESKPQLRFTVNGGNEITHELTLLKEKEYLFGFSASDFIDNDTIRAFFTYVNSNDALIRVPEKGSYGFIFGSMNISSITKVDNDTTVPDDYVLEQNFPNPFNMTTNIRFSVPVKSNVTIEVYDILGRKIRTLFNNTVPSKEQRLVRWNGINDSGAPVASGVYIYQIIADGFIKSRKMMLLK